MLRVERWRKAPVRGGKDPLSFFLSSDLRLGLLGDTLRLALGAGRGAAGLALELLLLAGGLALELLRLGGGLVLQLLRFALGVAVCDAVPDLGWIGGKFCQYTCYGDQ